MTRKEQVEEMYEHLCEIFGIGRGLWDVMHSRPSSAKFCPANQKNLIAEYLMLEDFVRQAKKYNVIYYFGIDEFLENYHDVVYDRIRIDAE